MYDDYDYVPSCIKYEMNVEYSTMKKYYYTSKIDFFVIIISPLLYTTGRRLDCILLMDYMLGLTFVPIYLLKDSAKLLGKL